MTRLVLPVRISPYALSPFRSPEWRWLMAKELLHCHADDVEVFDDETVRQTLQLQRCLGTVDTDLGASAMLARMSLPLAAHRIYSDGVVVRDEIEARLLSGEAFEVIAQKTGVAVDILRHFESLFFNVTDRLHSMDWLMAHAVGVDKWRHQAPTRRDFWCYYALAGGPLLLDFLIAEDLGRPEPSHPQRREITARLRLMLLSFAAS